MYLHLSKNSVRPSQIGVDIYEGDWIADSDNTGKYTTDPHLHLQIVIHPQPNLTISTLDSENRSRNPEIWLKPYNDIDGTVIGKVTYTGGTPVPGLKVYGLGKDPAWDYGWSETYTDMATLPPDDILVENWATTDVTPGNHHVTLSNGSDMGTHTVELEAAPF
jgi:hypothetical protein